MLGSIKFYHMALKHFHRNLDFAIYNGRHFITLLNMQTTIHGLKFFKKSETDSYEKVFLLFKCPNETHPTVERCIKPALFLPPQLMK